MTTKRIAEQLQDSEVKLLRELATRTITPSDIETLRAAMWLENKGLLTQSRTAKKVVSLDKLGKQYAESELPELKFLKLVHTPQDLIQLKKSLSEDEVKFSIGHLKGKGLINFKDGKVVAAPSGKNTKDTLESKLIAKLAKGSLELDSLQPEERQAYQELLKRKELVKTSDKTTITLEITKLGKDVALLASRLPKDRIGKLTSGMLKTGSWRNKTFRRYDVEASVPKMFIGKKQAYLAFLDQVKEELVAMGFQEMTGPIVESAFFNCDALFMPQDHPARGIHDIYSVSGEADLSRYASNVKSVKNAHETGGNTGSKGWRIPFSEEASRQLMLRSQGTAVSARKLMSKDLKIPGKYFSIARCYRPDVVDATHLTEFNQMEGIVLGEDLNLRQLLSMLSDFAKRLAGVEKVRFLTGYFPFTECSTEGFIYLKEIGKWVEVMPAGIFRPELTVPLGINVPVLAWGIGIDRLFMIKEGIKDIRHLFSDDLGWLRGART